MPKWQGFIKGSGSDVVLTRKVLEDFLSRPHKPPPPPPDDAPVVDGMSYFGVDGNWHRIRMVGMSDIRAAEWADKLPGGVAAKQRQVPAMTWGELRRRRDS